MDVCHADAAGRLQEDSARARAIARAGLRSRHRSAAEAVLLAQIPQTARVNKKDLKAPEVAFQGDPEFQPIEPTTVQRAVNTDKDVFKVGDLYYMCYQGVWFVGKTATGPWEVARSVPEQIYKIPVSSPAHHVTYVTIEERQRRRLGHVCGCCWLHRHDGRVGLHGLGLRLVLSALLGIRRLLSLLLPGTSQPTGIPRGTTRGRAHTDAARAYTVHMAALESVLATTRAPEPTRAALRPTALMARAAWRKRTTREPAPTLQPARVRTSTAVGDRPPCSAATTGPRPIVTPTSDRHDHAHDSDR